VTWPPPNAGAAWRVPRGGAWPRSAGWANAGRTARLDQSRVGWQRCLQTSVPVRFKREVPAKDRATAWSASKLACLLDASEHPAIIPLWCPVR